MATRALLESVERMDSQGKPDPKDLQEWPDCQALQENREGLECRESLDSEENLAALAASSVMEEILRRSRFPGRQVHPGPQVCPARKDSQVPSVLLAARVSKVRRARRATVDSKEKWASKEREARRAALQLPVQFRTSRDRPGLLGLPDLPDSQATPPTPAFHATAQ